MTPELRTRLLVALAFVLVAIGAFSAGRFSAPAQVETRDVERVVFKDLLVEDLTKGFTSAKVVDRTIRRNVTTKPDGTIVDRSIEHEGTREDVATTETTKRTEERAGEKDTERVSITTTRPDWRIAAQVGASLRAPALPITGPLVLGVSVERRIVGGVSAGLWANTVGAAGAQVSLEF